jgi:chromosome partitioning protein
MRTIVFSCLKGGVGKTTMTGHLAVTLERMGVGPVAVTDFDPQASLARWWNVREAELPAFAGVSTVAELPEKKARLVEEGVTYFLIDTPPAEHAINESVISEADLVVIPLKAGPHDVAAALNTVELCERLGKPFVFLVNEVKAGTSAAMDAVTALAGIGPVIPHMIGSRQGYSVSMTDGRTLAELQPKSKGAEELVQVAKFILSRFPENKRVKKEKAHVV